jgi:hypothetical protein
VPRLARAFDSSRGPPPRIWLGGWEARPRSYRGPANSLDPESRATRRGAARLSRTRSLLGRNKRARPHRSFEQSLGLESSTRAEKSFLWASDAGYLGGDGASARSLGPTFQSLPDESNACWTNGRRALGRLPTFTLFAPISLGPNPFGGSQVARDRVESRPRSPLEAPCAEASAVHQIPELSTFSTPRWGVSTGPREQPGEQPTKTPAAQPELPGEFVSEDLRADCNRFLEEARALAGRRAELLASRSRWVPKRRGVTSVRDAGTPPR